MADPETDNDVTREYLSHTQALGADATIDSFMQRMKARAASEPPPAATPAAGASDRAPLQITVRPKSVWERVGDAASAAPGMAGSVISDVAYGTMVEGAPAVVGGVNDTVRNTVSGVKGVADWLGEKIGGGNIPIPSTGNEFIDKLIGRPLDALTDVLPDKVKPQTTATGTILREGARFVTGFLPISRALGVAGVASPAANAIASGAITDFVTMDPDQEGLANLLQAVPVLGPVVRPVMINPDDPEALKRLKHGIEGAGFGGLAEGVFRGIRAVAQARKAVPEVEAQRVLHGEMGDRDVLMVASPDKPLVVTGAPKKGEPVDPFMKLVKATLDTETGVPDDVAAKGVKGSAKDGAGKVPAKTAAPEVYVNFARIDQPDDVKTVIRDMANAFKGSIDKARRGVQNNEQTAKLADELGMTPEDLLSRRKGQPFNAEESLAARRLLNASAENLLEQAKLAADPNASLATTYNFRRMMAIHQAIQSEVIAARTETARALQAWSIPASGKVEAARNIQALMDNMGGQVVSAELARRMALLASQGVSPGAIANMVRRGWAATSVDMVKESFVLGLLWSPSTHLVNSASNFAVGFQQVYERSVARAMGDFLGSAVDARVVDGEAIAMAYGMVSSLKDAFRLAARSLVTGESGAAIGSKIDIRPGAISSETVSRELRHSPAEMQAFAESGMGKFIDFAGEVTRVPGRLLGAEDEFFKTITYRAEVHAQSLRMASQEGLTGQDRFKRMMEIVNDPPEHIRISAADAALYTTFQNKPGQWAQSLMGLRSSGSLNPTFLVLPFIKTPANILRYTFERTPLAPLVSQWRDDIAAGGARRDLALARMATGTATMAVALDMASSGLITGAGPSDLGKREALMRQGWQPNSIYIDGKFYSFSRTDPLGMVFGFAGTVAEKMKEKDNAPEDFDQWNEILAAGIGVVSASVVDKTYFQGISRVMTAIQRSEQGSGSLTNFINWQAGSIALPASSASNVVKRFVDPVSREVNSPMDGIMAKIAGLSDRLPPARDLWGKERQPDEVYGRTYDVISPIAVREVKDSPIDAELERLNLGIRRIGKKGTFDGAEVNFAEFPKVYDEYVRLAGNELKLPQYGDKGAKDFLDDVVSGKSPFSEIYNTLYSDGPEGGKAAYIRNIVTEYRRAAQQQIMQDRGRFSEFIALVESRKAERQQLKMPPGLTLPGMSGAR